MDLTKAQEYVPACLALIVFLSPARATAAMSTFRKDETRVTAQTDPRPLNTRILDALQNGAGKNVRVLRVELIMPSSDSSTTVRKTVLTIHAQDRSEGDGVNRFKESVATNYALQKLLGPMELITLKGLSAPQHSPDGTPYVAFTLQCNCTQSENIVENQEIQTNEPLGLVLNGVTVPYGDPPLRRAMINNQTFMEGETDEIKLLDGSKVVIKCQEVAADSVLILVNGGHRKLTLRSNMARVANAKFPKLLAAANQGDAKAQYAVGLAYDHPYMDDWQDAVEENVLEAQKWYRRAAEQGYAPAQNALGTLYSAGRRNFRDGRAVRKDYYEAVRWFRKAADQGDGAAQENLGQCYLTGEGVTIDKVQAYKWLTLAARSESDKDQREGKESKIAELAGTMSPPQISLAERFVRDFLAQKRVPNAAIDQSPADSASPKASGSGFFISEDGALITNFHVVDGASRLRVTTKRGSFAAEVVRVDSANDIALVKVSGSGFGTLPITPSRNTRLAESVFTIGFPNPEMQGMEPKFTDGKVNSLSGPNDDARYFQISVAVQPGNSGGPLVNPAGNVMGIVTARLSDRAALEITGAIPQNVNYALKSSYLLALIESVPQMAGKLKTPWPAKQRSLDEIVKEAEDAVALVVVY